MNPFGISNISFDLLMNAFASVPKIEKVIVFGSRAKGNYRPGSDIDLAIMGKECNQSTALDLSAKINEDLPIPYTVDIIDYGSLNHPDLKDHIDRVGKIFYQKQTGFTD